MVLVPDDLGVSEVGRSDVDDRVSFVLFKAVSSVPRVGNLLRLAIRSIEGVDGDDSVVLIREEAGGVVLVDDGGSGEDAGLVVGGEEGDGLVVPSIQVGGSSVTPVLVTCDKVGRVV